METNKKVLYPHILKLWGSGRDVEFRRKLNLAFISQFPSFFSLIFSSNMLSVHLTFLISGIYTDQHLLWICRDRRMGAKLLRHKHFCVHTATGYLPILSCPMQWTKLNSKDIPFSLYEKNVKSLCFLFLPTLHSQNRLSCTAERQLQYGKRILPEVYAACWRKILAVPRAFEYQTGNDNRRGVPHWTRSWARLHRRTLCWLCRNAKEHGL